MKAKDLKVGYPIYHVEGYGCYGAKGDLITHIDQLANGIIGIQFTNFDYGTSGEYYPFLDEEVMLTPDENISTFELIKIEIKSWIRRQLFKGL